MAALEDRDRRVEHHGGIDLALLHRHHRRGAEADPDHRRRVRINARFFQLIFQEEIGRGTRRADAHLLAREVLDGGDLSGLAGRHNENQARIAVIDDEGLQLLLLGGECDRMIEIARDDIRAAADHGLQRLRASLEIHDLDGEPGLFEVAQLLGEDRWQVAEAGRASDRNGDLGLRHGDRRSWPATPSRSRRAFEVFS